MEKELKSCLGAFLRSDLTGHVIQAVSGKIGGMASMQNFNSFFIMFYCIISTKIGDLFCPVMFQDFGTVCWHRALDKKVALKDTLNSY